MILTGAEIRRQIDFGNITIDPYVPENVGINSVDLRLGNALRVYDFERPFAPRPRHLDMRKDNPTREIQIPEDGYILLPGILYLGSTMERTHTDLFVPKVEGRSSVGRLGMKVHLTAGFGDIGFNGRWTLEIEVTHALKIYPWVRVCQVYFSEPSGPIDDLYQGRYQGHTEATASRFHIGLEEEQASEA